MEGYLNGRAKQDTEYLKTIYKEAFNRLSVDEEKTIEFYYSLAESRGVNGLLYVKEAINRASFKQNLNKPISYVASLCKNFFKFGLHSQQFQEEIDIMNYIESKIGLLSNDNKHLIQTSISRNGYLRVITAAAEVLNNSNMQKKIVEEIILKAVDVIGREDSSDSD